MEFTPESQPDFEREWKALFNEAKKVFQLDHSRTQHGFGHWLQVEKNVVPTIGVCWDADRLDLPRVGTRPTSDRMSTPYGKQCCAGK
jgi:hypothetical protein